jgi:8-oxo-dGTP pyrophosphatase MutT (NUDIX family)
VLTASDAVVAIICLDDGRYLMQHRDERSDIWYPGHWGCFGGAVEPGESPEDALARELYEELEFRPRQPAFLTRFDFDFGLLGMGTHYRIYYVVRITEAERRALVLHEGQAVDAFDYASLANGMRVAAYDRFALDLYALALASGRARPGFGIIGP